MQIKNEIIDLSQGAQAVEFLSINAVTNRRSRPLEYSTPGMAAPERRGRAQIQENSMGTVEPQAVAGSEVKQASDGQIVAKMLKQEGVKHIFRWPGSAVK